MPPLNKRNKKVTLQKDMHNRMGEICGDFAFFAQ